jgi:hypothetical protein
MGLRPHAHDGAQVNPWFIVGILWLLSRTGRTGQADGSPPTPPPGDPKMNPAGIPTRVEVGYWRALPLPVTAADVAVLSADLHREGTLAPYIQRLYDQQVRYLGPLRAYWTKDRLRSVARAAASYYGVPPEWVWGLLWRESAWRPVGVYGGSATKAQAVPSNVYGMGQMLGSRYGTEQAAAPAILWWAHSGLLSPPASVWTVAASLGRALASRGGGPGSTAAASEEAARRFAAEDDGTAVGGWWASPGRVTEGARRKTSDVAVRGPDVWGETDPDPALRGMLSRAAAIVS